ncbi:MAG: metal ABC transporter permease, partial [Pseudomonadota bacterium]
EKQRVGVARAILLEPAILVLDEATSAMDSKTEEHVRNALEAASKGRTTIAVAHRLSTVVTANKIIVVEEGRVTAEGSHAELIERNRTYQDLWKAQSSGSLERVLVQ